MPYSECLKKQMFTKVYWLQNPGTNMAKEQDINNNKEYVSYADDAGIAHVADFSAFLRNQEAGKEYVEVYDQEDENRATDTDMFAGMLQAVNANQDH